LKPCIQASFPLFLPALAGHDADHQDPRRFPGWVQPLFATVNLFSLAWTPFPSNECHACFFIETRVLNLLNQPSPPLADTIGCFLSSAVLFCLVHFEVQMRHWAADTPLLLRRD
jgi:hypothetical protein